MASSEGSCSVALGKDLIGISVQVAEDVVEPHLMLPFEGFCSTLLGLLLREVTFACCHLLPGSAVKTDI